MKAALHNFVRATMRFIAAAIVSVSLSNHATSDTLVANEYLHYGQRLSSPGCFYHLDMQADGNLVLYGSMQQLNPLWASNTGGVGAYAVMQPDGNLVVYNWSNAPVWHREHRASGGRAWICKTTAISLSTAEARRRSSQLTARSGRQGPTARVSGSPTAISPPWSPPWKMTATGRAAITRSLTSIETGHRRASTGVHRTAAARHLRMCPLLCKVPKRVVG
jgi:hypothetical protein